MSSASGVNWKKWMNKLWKPKLVVCPVSDIYMYVTPFFATVVCICLYLYESVLMLMVGLLLVLVLLIYNPTTLFELLCVITVIYVYWILVWLRNHSQICPWNQSVLSNISSIHDFSIVEVSQICINWYVTKYQVY